MNVLGATAMNVTPVISRQFSDPSRMYVELGGVSLSMSAAEARGFGNQLLDSANEFEANAIQTGNSDLVPAVGAA